MEVHKGDRTSLALYFNWKKESANFFNLGSCVKRKSKLILVRFGLVANHGWGEVVREVGLVTTSNRILSACHSLPLSSSLPSMRF